MEQSKDRSDWSKSFMYSLHETYFLVEKHLEEKLTEAAGVTFSQFLIMLPLHCERTACQTEIANFLHLTEATVSRHISGMTEDGLLTRKDDPVNRRKHILALTAKGLKEFTRAQKVIEVELKSIFEVIPSGDRANIIHAFDRVLEKLLAMLRGNVLKLHALVPVPIRHCRAVGKDPRVRSDELKVVR